jgi:hypothetical protein
MTTLRVFTAAVATTTAVFAAACGSAADTDTAPDSASAPDLTAAPADLHWRTVAGVSIPVSSVDGPTTTNGTVRSGYSKTPQGAVLAAINGHTALAVTGDRAWPEVVNTVTAPGPGRDEFAAARAGVSVSGNVPTDTAPTFVGFEVTDYQSDPLSAAVSIAQRVGGDHGGLYSYPVALQWIAGDWRIVLPTAEENIDASELNSLDGYTALEKTS